MMSAEPETEVCSSSDGSCQNDHKDTITTQTTPDDTATTTNNNNKALVHKPEQTTENTTPHNTPQNLFVVPSAAKVQAIASNRVNSVLYCVHNNIITHTLMYGTQPFSVPLAFELTSDEQKAISSKLYEAGYRVSFELTPPKRSKQNNHDDETAKIKMTVKVALNSE